MATELSDAAVSGLHASTEELEAGLDHVRRAPVDGGRLDQIVRRPGLGEREAVTEARLDVTEGLIGDGWIHRPSSKMAGKAPHPDMQVTLMNARAAALVARTEDRWQLAGDQLYVDLDLSGANVPPGTRLAIGAEAVIEVTSQPHTGCAKFAKRFGRAAARFVNSPPGLELNLRGINTKVVTGGAIGVGDCIRKLG